MIQAVLFDLDGTLTNTIDDIATAMNRALRLHGLPGWETKEYCYLVGNGAKILAQRAVRDRQDLADAVQAEYQAYYEKHTQVKTQPYDGIPELLHALAERGLKLAVLSNKPDADTKNVISHFFPDVPFSVVRGQVEGVPVKPDPTGVEQILSQLGAEKAETLFVGDSAVDIHTAHNAGLRACGVTWGFRGRGELADAGADFLADTVLELERCILQM